MMFEGCLDEKPFLCSGERGCIDVLEMFKANTRTGSLSLGHKIGFLLLSDTMSAS